jgi:hypothetical protein
MVTGVMPATMYCDGAWRGLWRLRATVVLGMQQNDQEMRKLTRMLARRSERMINASSELNFADSGDDL